MVTIAIVGILSAIAVPAYRSYLDRTYIAEAFNVLSGDQIQMQQYFQDNGTYANGTACAVAMANTTHFTISCALNGSGFIIKATSAAVDGLSVGEYVFTIDDANNQQTTSFQSISVSAQCWLLKSGTSC